MVRDNQIAQLPARVLRRAERMVVRKHPGQEQALGFPDDGPHLKPADTVHPGRHADRLRHRRGLHPRHPCHALAGTLGRKPEPAFGFERGQRRDAARYPQPSPGVGEAEARANRAGNRHPSRKPVERSKAGQERLPSLRLQGAREWKVIRSWRRQNSRLHDDCLGAT